MSKVSDFFSGLGNTAVSLTGSVAQAASNVAAARDSLKGPKTSDQTGAHGVATVQSGPLGIPLVWLGAGALVLLGGVLLLRRK